MCVCVSVNARGYRCARACVLGVTMGADTGLSTSGREARLCPTIPYPQRSKNMSLESQGKVSRQLWL